MKKNKANLWQLTPRKKGLIDIVSNDKIKVFINQLFNYDLTTDLSIKIKLIKWDFNFSIPINGQIKKIYHQY